MFLFCMKPYGHGKYYNQRRAVEVCRKQRCSYLEEAGEIICHCPPNHAYFLAFKTIKKDALKKENEGGEEE